MAGQYRVYWIADPAISLLSVQAQITSVSQIHGIVLREMPFLL